MRLDELLELLAAGERAVAKPRRVRECQAALARLRAVLDVAGVIEPQLVHLESALERLRTCDEQLPDVRRELARVRDTDTDALVSLHAGGGDLPFTAVAGAPHGPEYAGLVATEVHLRARRRILARSVADAGADGARRALRERVLAGLDTRAQHRAADPDAKMGEA